MTTERTTRSSNDKGDEMHEAAPKSKRRQLWLAAGVAAGLVLAPTAAVAAGIGMTSLVGPNGTKAAVARTGQVITATADPNEIRGFVSSIEGDDSESPCTKLYSPPHGYSFVVTQIVTDTWENPTPGADNDVAIYTGTTSQNCKTEVNDVNPPSFGDQVLPFTPGMVIPAGDDISAIAYGGISVELYGLGYLVPSADAPHLTPATPRLAPSAVHHSSLQR